MGHSVTVDMAVNRSTAQKAEVGAYIQALYKESGCPTWSDFAEKAGVHWASLSDWQLGKRMPDGWNVYCLIRAVAAAKQTDSLQAATESVRLQDSDRLATVEANLRALSADVRAGFAALAQPRAGGQPELPAKGEDQG